MSRLRDVLKSRNPSLHRQVEALIDRATPQLWHTWSTFPSGTKHTPEHTQSVETIAGLLLPSDVIATMTDDEIAMLILSCHYHDLGMAGTEADNSTPEGRDLVRREHAISIGDRIRAHWEELGFDSSTQAETLAEICRGHRPLRNGGVATWDEIPELLSTGLNRFVRPRLVSAMIFAADELHLGDDRAPKREENWKQITNAESSRHWHGHQAISGPVRVQNLLCFDVRVATISFESHIRKVLHKALSAVADMKRELLTAGIESTLPEIRIQWIRNNLWDLLIAKLASDLAPRTQEQLRGDVLQYYSENTGGLTSLGGLATETPNSDIDLGQQIDRSRSDHVTRDFLIVGADPQTLILATTPRCSEHMLSRMREADRVEQLFSGAFAASHEHAFYASSAGRQFIATYVFNEIKSSYSLDLSTMPQNSPLRAVIESSPTACRILREISPPPSTLVQQDVLEVAATAGICFDLMSNPDLFLETSLRHAVRGLFAAMPRQLAKFLRFIQELSLVKGFSFEEVISMVLPSAAAIEEAASSESGESSLSMTQSFPRDRPHFGFPYLLLAGQRSQQPITIRNTAELPFQISIATTDSAAARLNDEQPMTIEISPGLGPSSSIMSLRARIDFDRPRKLLRLICQRLNDMLHDDAPIIVQLPTAKPADRMPLSLSLVHTSFRVGQLLELQRASELSAVGFEMQIHIEGVGLLASEHFTTDKPFPIKTFIGVEHLTALAEINASLAVPLLIKQDAIEQISRATPEIRNGIFEAISASLNGNKPKVTSVRLRFASSEGTDFREEFLGMLPPSIHFSAPQIADGTITQQELDQKWDLGNDTMMCSMSFREDSYELAADVRQWMDNPELPFPFHCVSDLATHYCKTRAEFHFLPHIDRHWYIERPLVIRLRPATKVEQYRIELEFWQSRGDSRRAELISELLREIEPLANEQEGSDDTPTPPDVTGGESELP